MNLDKLKEKRVIIFWSIVFILWIAWFINSPLSNPLRKFLGLNYAAVYSSTPNNYSDAWIPNSSVFTIVPDNSGGYYIGGSFTALGQYVGNGLPMDINTGSSTIGFSKVNGPVEVVVKDNSGGWYIGGSFTQVGGATHNRLAHILSDGTVDSNFNPDINDTVRTITVSNDGNHIYVGGNFTQVNSTPFINKFVVLSSTDGSIVDGYTNIQDFSSTVFSSVLSTTTNTLYVGGDFSSIGEYTGRAVIINTSDGSKNGSIAKVNTGFVDDAISDGSGGWYIAGTFTQIGTTNINYLAHIFSDGSLDQNFNFNPNGQVYSLTLSTTTNTLYVGGSFTTIGGLSRNRLAAINLSSGVVDSNFNPNINGTVSSLILSNDGSTLYIGGTYSTVGTTTRNRLASVNTSDGSLVTSFNPNVTPAVSGGCCGGINSMQLSADSSILYFGGTTWNTVGGVTRNRIAAVNTSDGSLVTAFDPNANNTVSSIKLSTTTGVLYLGGSFTTIGGVTRNRIAAVNTSDGSLVTSFDPNLDSSVSEIVISPDGNYIYAGGAFTTVGTSSRPYFAKINISDGSPANFFDFAGGNSILSIVPSFDGSNIYIGGAFSSFGSTTRSRNKVAAIDLSNGITNSTFNPNVANTVTSLSLSPNGNILYLGGSFTTVGTTTRNRLAAVNTSDGSLVTSFNPNSNSALNKIILSPDGNTLYLGGTFTTIGGVTRNRIAAVNTSDGSLVTAFDPNANSIVNSLDISSDGGILYVGGIFDTISSTTRSRIAAVNTSDGSPVTSFNPSVDSTVLSMAISSNNNTLYIGGNFTLNNLITRNRIAHILSDGTLNHDFNPNVGNTVSDLSLSSDGNILYIGGSFTTVGTTTRNRLAAVNTSDGSLITSFDPNLNNAVNSMSLSPDGNILYLGGSFTTVGTTTRNRLAAVNTSDGSLVTSFDPNANSSVGTLALSLDGNSLYVGGLFTTIGTTTRNRLAAVNTSDGSLVTSFDPNVSANIIRAKLSPDGSVLYLGGQFTTVGGVTRNRLAAVNTSNGTLLTSFNPNVSADVNNFVLSDSLLYLVGSFTTVGGVTRNRVAAVNVSDGSLVTSFDPNANSSVNSLAISLDGNTLYMGGSFTSIGSNPVFSRLTSFPLVPDTTTRTSYRYVTPIVDELSQVSVNTETSDGLATTSTSTSSTTPILSGTTTPTVETKPIVTTQIFTFERNLRQGMISEDVRQLQKFLNTNGFTVAQTGPGSAGEETNYFGNLTRLALIKFQEVYIKDILSPLNLEKGTGFFGPYSRGVMNRILLGE